VKTEYYNIHDILTIKVNKKGYKGFFSNINPEFDYFRVNELYNFDILMNLGRFNSKRNEALCYDNNYAIGDNYLFINHSEGRTKWTLEFEDIEEDRIIINYNPMSVDFRELCIYFSMQDIFLRRLIELLLMKKGFNLIHGACLVHNCESFLLIGKQHSYKTSISMDLVRKYNMGYQGDERVLVKDGKTYSYPINLHSFTFWSKYMKDEFTRSRPSLYYLKLLKWIIESSKKRKYGIDIPTTAKLKRVYVLKRDAFFNQVRIAKIVSDNKTFAFIRDNNEEDWDHPYMPFLTGMKGDYFKEYLSKYLLYNKKAWFCELWDNFENNLKINLGGIEYFNVELPLNYSEDIVNDLFLHIRNASLER